MVWRSRTHSWSTAPPLALVFCSVTIIILSVRQESVQSVPDIKERKTWKYHF
jgi:hypothetical protein